MAVSSDMIRTWAAPRRVMRGLLSQGQREDRALAYLMVGCLLVFIAQWPRLSRIAHLEGQEFIQLVGYSFVGIMIVWPLAFYILTLILFALMRGFGQRIEIWQVRLATFWAFLAAAPAGLLYGLTVAFVGPGGAAQLVGAVWLIALAVFVVQGLRESGQGDGG